MLGYKETADKGVLLSSPLPLGNPATISAKNIVAELGLWLCVPTFRWVYPVRKISNVATPLFLTGFTFIGYNKVYNKITYFSRRRAPKLSKYIFLFELFYNSER
jgi:hypothetical protein